MFINKSLRNILRIWWPRKISNKELWRQTGQRPIAQDLAMDGSHVEESRWTCSQEGTGVESTGEAKEREAPAHLATYENGRVGEKTTHVE